MGFINTVVNTLCFVFGIETKAEKEAKVQSEQKAFGTSQKVEQPASDKEKEEKERVWKDVSDPFKFVCQAGKVECKYCNPPMADILVTSSTIMLQDKPWATIKDKDGKVNFNFTGVCTHPSQQKPGSPPPPCKSIISLGQWKDFSNTFVGDNRALMLKSTIPCNISGEDLKITDCGQKAVISDVSIELPKIQVKILKIDTEYFTPLGIQNPLKNDPNTKDSIKVIYEITGQDAKYVQINISSNEDKICSLVLQDLEEVVVTAKRTGKTKAAESPQTNENNKWTTQGEHYFEWDGFDDDGILDSQKLLGKLTFEVFAIPVKGNTGAKSTLSVKTEKIVQKVKWLTLKIDKASRKVDVRFNVNLKDGGTRGINSKTTAYYTGNAVPGMPGLPQMGTYTIGDWDENVPKAEINRLGKEPIKGRIRSFDELVELTLKGVNTYWSRNSTRQSLIGDGINIDSEKYLVTVNAINTDRQPPHSLDDVPLIFNTNGEWGRSGNPGHTYGDNLDVPIVKLIDDGLIQQITYNVGYIERSSGWKYDDIQYADEDFMFTAAHELGHEILQAFGSTVYSWQHKGTSYYFPQDKKPTNKKWSDIKPDFMPNTSGENYPKTGEQDLMKYYHQELTPDKKYALSGSFEDHARIVAAEDDVKGLIWLTSIKIIK